MNIWWLLILLSLCGENKRNCNDTNNCNSLGNCHKKDLSCSESNCGCVGIKPESAETACGCTGTRPEKIEPACGCVDKKAKREEPVFGCNCSENEIHSDIQLTF